MKIISFCLILLLSARVEALASPSPSPIQIRVDHGAKRAAFVADSRIYKLPLPGSTKRIEKLSNRLVILDRSGLDLKILHARDVVRIEGTMAQLPSLGSARYTKISLQSLFGGEGPRDFAAFEQDHFIIFYFTKAISPSPGSPDRVQLSQLTVAKRDVGLEETEGTQFMPPPKGKIDGPIAVLPAGPTEILGSGKIAIVSDPASASPLLLSLDESHRLIHEYALAPNGETSFRGSYALNIEDKPLSLFRSEQRFDHFLIETKGGLAHYSLLKMRIARALQRTAIKNAVTNEVQGNAWVKNLLFMGLLSAAIDKLDRYIADPRFESAEKLLDDSEINLFDIGADPDEFFQQLRETQLFSEIELEKMQREHDLESGKGRKWFIIAGFVLSYFGWLKVKKNHYLLESLHRKTADKIKATLLFSAKMIGLNPNNQLKISRLVERRQRKYKAWVLRNHHNEKYPIKIIKEIERTLKRIAKTTGGQAGDDTLAFLAKNKRHKSLKTRTEALIEFNDSKTLQNLIAGYEKKLIKRSSAKIRFSARFMKTLESKPVKLATNGLSLKIIDRWKKINLLSSGQKLSANAEKLKVLNTHIDLSQDILNLRAQVLAVLQKKTPSLSLRSAKGTEYLHITGAEDILARAQKAQELAVRMKMPAKYRRIAETMKDKLAQLARVEETISGYTTMGKVWRGFDFWAKHVATLHARYFIFGPIDRSKRASLKKVSDLSKRWLRADHVYVNKRFEPIQITGENVKMAFWTGVGDVSLDLLTQYRARQNSIDPWEKIWGESPYHIDISPGEGRGGVHFDLVANFINQIVGWSLGMPLSYARMNKSYGSSSAISYWKRIKDGLLKSYNPFNIIWGTAHSYPVYLFASGQALKSYHQNAGENHDPRIHEQVEEKIHKRLTSFWSILERKVYGGTLSMFYISPQYYMQSELNQVLPKIIPGGKKAVKIISMLVMPITTGYKYHEWWPNYFGATNPDMIKLLRTFKAQGVLKKIDENGFTDLRRWSPHEITTVSTLITLLEMQKLEKEIPLPVGDPVALANWYALLYERLSRGQDMADFDLEKDLAKVKIGPAPGEDREFIYAQEAGELLDTLKALEGKMKILPSSSGRADHYIVQRERIDPEKEALSKFDSLLDDALMVQSHLSETVLAMKTTKGAFKTYQRGINTIAIVDSLILFDLLFNGKLEGILRELKGKGLSKNALRAQKAMAAAQSKYRGIVGKMAKRSIIPARLAAFPIYFWVFNQAKAHTLMEKQNADLLEELQNILFTLTFELGAAQVKGAYAGRALPVKMQGKLRDYARVLGEKKSALEQLLRETQARNEVLSGQRLHYRAPRIFSDYAPYGAGMGLSWMGVRHFLWKNTRGYVSRMSDRYAPGLVKLSVILWFGLGHIANGYEQEISLTTYDMFKLTSAYQQTLMEEAMIDDLIKNRNVDGKKDYFELIKDDELLKRVLPYRDQFTRFVEEGGAP